MATVREYIAAKLNRYYIDITDAELDGMLADSGLIGDDTYATDLSKPVKQALVSFIPELFLAPESISQGDFTIKRSQAGLKEYYAILCADLGIVSESISTPKIVNKSNIW